jgi:hypothetical protein
VSLKVIGLKTGVPGNPSQHSRSDLITVVETENVIGPVCPFEDSV